jgi:DNA invertase Pin-like site-specific DNA recombinase
MKRLPRTFEDLRGLRARGLVRESTRKQGENSGPAVQRRSAIDFASKWGLDLPHVPDSDPAVQGFDGGTYSDFVSGSRAARRPQFLRMVADAEAGAFDVLLVYDTSRFARDRREAAIYEQKLHNAGVVVVYIVTNDLSSADQQVAQAVHSALSQEFLTVHGTKVQQAYRHKRFDAGKWSGTVPIGFRMRYDTKYNPAKGMDDAVESGILVPDTEPQPLIGFDTTYTRADLVRLIGETYTTGRFGFRPLAAHLNLLGYRNSQGEPFSGNAIRVIVSNPVYTGRIGWHKRPDKERKAHDFHETEWKTGPHEPLWSEALWESILAVRQRAFRGSNGGKVHNIYPLRRLAVCDRCGVNLYGEAHQAAKGQRPALYMACTTQRERHGCDQRAVRSARLEDQVGEWLTTLVIPTDWRGDIERLQRREAQVQRPAVDTARIERQLANLRELFLQADITREEYVGRKRALMASLNGGAAQPTYSEAVLVRAARLLADLGELWSKATPTERTEIAASLFAEVRVRDERIVRARLARPDYLPLIASATARSLVGVARPEGFEPPTGTPPCARRGLPTAARRDRCGASQGPPTPCVRG